MTYSCNQCQYKATQQSNLKIHQQSKHEGVKYSCNLCQYQTGLAGNLKKHQQFKHKGEATIHQDCINELMDVALDLEVKELSKDDGTNSEFVNTGVEQGLDIPEEE